MSVHGDGVPFPGPVHEADALRLGSDRAANRPEAAQDYLDTCRLLIEDALADAVRSGEPPILYEAMRYSLLAGGKRLRPILCLSACELAGGGVELALPTAVAIEMVHTMSLIHDDLPAMDNGRLRRGRPTSHVVYGEALAILSGDALLMAAFEYLITRTTDVPASRVLAVIQRLAHALGPAGLAGGQAMDVLGSDGGPISSRDVDVVHARKTAALMEAAVVCGALLAGASPSLLARLRRYGANLGRAFQIVDDVLDVTGSAEQLGKEPGRDAPAGKASYAAILGVEACQRRAEQLIEQAVAVVAAEGAAARPLSQIARLVLARSR